MSSTLRSLTQLLGVDAQGARRRRRGGPGRGRAGTAPASAAGRPGPWRPPGRAVARSRRASAGRRTAAREPGDDRARAARRAPRRTRRRRRPSSSSARPGPLRVTTSRSQAVASSGPGTSGLDAARRRGAAPSPAPGADQDDRPLGGRRGREPVRGGPDVGAGRHVVRAGPAGAARLALRPGRAGRPAPRRGRCRGPRRTSGRSSGRRPTAAGAGCVAARLARAAVVELDRAALLGGLPEHVERRLVGAQPRLGDVEGGRRRGRRRRAVSLRTASVVASASRACSQTRVARPITAASSASRLDVGQRELVGPDPVARLVVEERVHAAHLDRHAEAAQLLLVALEHLLEGVVGRSRGRGSPRIRSLET